VGQKRDLHVGLLLPITLANINRFSNFSLLNSAINLQQSIYYISHDTLTVLLHYLQCEIKLLIMLFCKHNKCKCGYFWTWKTRLFFTHLILVDPGIKINGVYNWEVLRNRKCCRISVQFLATSSFFSRTVHPLAHRAHETVVLPH